MNLYQLYYFKTLARLEHYTKAAEELNMTQPSLSHAISGLEEELNVTLFEKSGRNIRLTEYGKKLLPYVENALNELEAGAKKMTEMSDEKNANISVGFIYTLTSQCIPKLIRGFKQMEENKNITFSLKENWSREECMVSLVKNLKEGKFDLILISLIPNDPEVEFVPIFDQNLVALLPNDSPLARQTSIDLKDTESFPLIQYTGKIGLRQEINRLFAMVDMVPNVYCEVEDELAMASLVAANMGMAIVPDNPNIRKFKEVAIRPIHNPLYTRRIYIGYMKNRQLPQSVQRFRDYVVKSFCDNM